MGILGTYRRLKDRLMGKREVKRAKLAKALKPKAHAGGYPVCPLCGFYIFEDMERHYRVVHNLWNERPKDFCDDSGGGLVGASRGSFGDWIRGKF